MDCSDGTVIVERLLTRPVGTSSSFRSLKHGPRLRLKPHMLTLTPLSTSYGLTRRSPLYELRSTLLVSPTHSSMTNTCLTPLLTGETLW